MSTILITGVRGNTGRHVARYLTARGDVTVRGGSGDPSAVGQTDVVPVRFDWDDPESWRRAADGADAVYIQRPERKDAPELIGAFLDATDDFERVVVLGDNVHGDQVPSSSWEGQVEEAVTSRAKTWTLLRPTWFVQSLAEPRYLVSSIKDAGVIEVPTAGASIAWVDTRDIAEVAVLALTNGDHAGKAYQLTGPDPVTIAYLAERLTDAIGHEVRHVDSPLEVAVDNFANIEGVDPWYVEYIHSVWKLVSNGSAAVVTNDIEELTGHKARNVDAFITAHADVWRR